MDGKKDAFAMMRAAQQGKKQAAASSSSSAAPEPSTSSATAPPPAPVFKGSGLGAGPRHFVDPANQPWVEK